MYTFYSNEELKIKVEYIYTTMIMCYKNGLGIFGF